MGQLSRLSFQLIPGSKLILSTEIRFIVLDICLTKLKGQLKVERKIGQGQAEYETLCHCATIFYDLILALIYHDIRIL